VEGKKGIRWLGERILGARGRGSTVREGLESDFHGS